MEMIAAHVRSFLSRRCTATEIRNNAIRARIHDAGSVAAVDREVQRRAAI
jgi:hypothetical protein